jgi:hypothetical protein
MHWVDVRDEKDHKKTNQISLTGYMKNLVNMTSTLLCCFDDYKKKWAESLINYLTQNIFLSQTKNYINMR